MLGERQSTRVKTTTCVYEIPIFGRREGAITFLARNRLPNPNFSPAFNVDLNSVFFSLLKKKKSNSCPITPRKKDRWRLPVGPPKRRRFGQVGGLNETAPFLRPESGEEAAVAGIPKGRWAVLTQAVEQVEQVVADVGGGWDKGRPRCGAPRSSVGTQRPTHLPCGECTVTLEDVALHFGFPIDGSAVTGVSAIAEPDALCYSLLGASPSDNESNFMDLKFTWLKANFEHLSVNATEEELMCAARAYIMHIIEGVLMPNTNNNRVHLQYLPLLADLRNVRSYSWGSTILAMLYSELCRTTKPDVLDIGGCLVLLQSWALYRMPFLASVSHQPYVFPLVNRWSIYPGIGRSYTVLIYHLIIEQHAREGAGYSNIRDIPEIVAIIPSSAYVDSQLWCTNAPIINFNVVEWYHRDRVLRQFDCIQYIPDPPMQVEKVYGINKRGKHGSHWGIVY
ncbi:hypothetical protein CXB51_013855 [Gossypium anomalum]|uniref:Aminotransferase-like plant mobile domain-containing protein n=1 Tax=Gossypium anomalum TaxID=47600 RepID=A0A8J6D488_9ROSI|nr:hypothetical protein CXB51_013855 [Gossypium anomalum]